MRSFVVLAAFVAQVFLQTLPASAAQDGSAFHPGDKLAVIVFNHPELSSEPMVDGMGQISLPLIGNVNVSGLSTLGLTEKIERRLEHFLIHPAVGVQLTTPGTSLFVVGPVAGVLTYSPGETLISALAQVQALQAAPPVTNAGGSTAQAPTSSASLDLRTLRESGVDLRAVVLRRSNIDGPPINVEELLTAGLSGPALSPGDIIALHARPIAVQVRGLVEHPILAHLYADEPLIDALRQAGGESEASAQFSFTLIRDGQPLQVTRLSPIVSDAPHTGDQIIVHEAPRVFVAGQVQKPGLIAVQGDQTLLTALYIAGGPQPNGDLRRVTILRQGKQLQYDLTQVRDNRLLNNPTLADGDSVFVASSRRVDFGVIFQGLLVAKNYALF